MLDILHNGVTKKIDGLKETEGLLIISGKPTWVSTNERYTAVFVDSRIRSTHTIQSIKVTTDDLSGHSTTDLTVNDADADDGSVSITISDKTIVQNNSIIITVTMYDITATATPSGMPMSLLGQEVSFTDWKMTQIYGEDSEDAPVFSGTVAVKIEDDGLSAPSLATVVDKTFGLISRLTNVNVHGIKETLPDGRLVCDAWIEMSPDVEDPVFPTSASDASINYLYIASDTIRMALPEADAEWVEQEGSSEEDRGVIFYEATFAAEVLASVHVNDVIIVRGENGEEFPEIGTLEEERPKMYSYTIGAIGGPRSIVVHWTRDTMPETTKLTAEVYVANYEAVNVEP